MSHLCDCRTSEAEFPCVTCKWLVEERIKQEILGKLESISFRHNEATYHLNGHYAYMSRDAKSISIEELMDALIKGEQK